MLLQLGLLTTLLPMALTSGALDELHTFVSSENPTNLAQFVHSYVNNQIPISTASHRLLSTSVIENCARFVNNESIVTASADLKKAIETTKKGITNGDTIPTILEGSLPTENPNFRQFQEIGHRLNDWFDSFIATVSGDEKEEKKFRVNLESVCDESDDEGLEWLRENVYETSEDGAFWADLITGADYPLFQQQLAKFQKQAAIKFSVCYADLPDDERRKLMNIYVPEIFVDDITRNVDKLDAFLYAKYWREEISQLYEGFMRSTTEQQVKDLLNKQSPKMAHTVHVYASLHEHTYNTTSTQLNQAHEVFIGKETDEHLSRNENPMLGAVILCCDEIKKICDVVPVNKNYESFFSGQKHGYRPGFCPHTTRMFFKMNDGASFIVSWRQKSPNEAENQISVCEIAFIIDEKNALCVSDWKMFKTDVPHLEKVTEAEKKVSVKMIAANSADCWWTNADGGKDASCASDLESIEWHKSDAGTNCFADDRVEGDGVVDLVVEYPGTNYAKSRDRCLKNCATTENCRAVSLKEEGGKSTCRLLSNAMHISHMQADCQSAVLNIPNKSSNTTLGGTQGQENAVAEKDNVIHQEEYEY